MKIDFKDMKTKVFKDNEKYFKFVNKDGIKVYSVEFNKNKNIKVYYKSSIVRKKKTTNKKVDKSKAVCV